MDKCNITCKQIVNCLKRCFTIKLNQWVYRFTVPIIALTALGILGYIYFKYPGSKIMDTSNLLVIISIIVSLLAVVIDSRANRRARIEPMIIDKPAIDEFGIMVFNAYFLKIKNIGLNAARDVRVAATFIDSDNILDPFRDVNGFNSLEESKRLLIQPRYIAPGEYCEVILFAFNYKHNKKTLEKLDRASLHVIISFQDERSGVLRKTALNIPFSQFLNTRMSIESSKKPALKQIIELIKQTKSSFLVEKNHQCGGERNSYY